MNLTPAQVKLLEELGFVYESGAFRKKYKSLAHPSGRPEEVISFRFDGTNCYMRQGVLSSLQHQTPTTVEAKQDLAKLKEGGIE